ncbi:ras guanine nucleotide exchange factor R-like [Schistocerca gregaria]|uniref:ras guanine nucleotide exchange factor R-like n=1 Tax=Schistocerca gregaria TaxID=7010 RepID=UPI00211F2F0B|nr:ras guanine nucleotide exchange factor R-like [Schistocerca gregaria]
MDQIGRELEQSDVSEGEKVSGCRDSPGGHEEQWIDLVSERELEKELSVKEVEKLRKEEKKRTGRASEIARSVCVCEKPYKVCFGNVRPSELRDVRSLVRVLSVCGEVGSKWLSRRKKMMVEKGRMEYKRIDPMEIGWRELRKRMEEQERKDEENIELDPETHMVRAGDIYAIVRWFVRRWRGGEKTLQFLHAYHVYIDHLTLLRELVALYLVPVGRSKELGYRCPKIKKALEKGRHHVCRSIRRRVLAILSDWVKFRYGSIYRYDEQKNFFNFLFKFISKLHPKNSEPLLKALQMALQQSLELALLRSFSSAPFNHAVSHEVSILDFSPSVIAQHITMTHQMLVSHLSLEDFLSPVSPPSLSRLIRRFNFLSAWICAQVLQPRSSPKHRAAVISHFIYTMHHLQLLRNYDGVMLVLSALHNCSLSRLRKSWGLLSPQSLLLLEVSSNLFSRNSSLYRMFIALHPPPCFPVLETLLRDLTIINENSTSIHSHPVNLHKLLLLGKSLQLASKSLLKPYMLSTNPHLEALISSSECPSDQELYSRSLQLEPAHKQSRCIHVSSPTSLLLKMKHSKAHPDK